MKTILLDRDGTMLFDPPDERIDRIDKIKLFPDSIVALSYLADHDFNVIIITNQAGIAEGRINHEEFEEIHREILHRLSPSRIHVLKTYMCPHISKDNCDCRKPKPKMILDAIQDFHLIPGETYMVGDHDSDIQAAKHAGAKAILVKTSNQPESSPDADYIAPTLLDAVKYVDTHSKG